MQYFYIGDVNKANYYLDRSTKGRLEKKESKVREMYMSHLSHKRAHLDKNQVSFALLNSVSREGDADQDYNRGTLSMGGMIRISNIVSHLKKKVRNSNRSGILQKNRSGSNHSNSS